MHTKSLVTVAAIALGAVALTGTGAVAGSLVTSRQIKDKTIQVRDLAPATVASLRKASAPRYYQVRVTRTIADGQNLGYNVACKSGDLAVGGGVKPSGPGVLQQGSYPAAPVAGNGWVQQVWNSSGGSQSIELYAVCLDR